MNYSDNVILKTDSYKMGHANQYSPGTEVVYSYFESRKGSKYDSVPFFGLQYILKKHFCGPVVTKEAIDQAEKLVKAHLGSEKHFNRSGWEYILDKYNGCLPVRIKAVPEGMFIPTNNVLLTIENTNSNCAWITNYMETLLSHLWFPCTVGALSRNVRNICGEYYEKTSDSTFGVKFMLHCFGYRGTSSNESAGIGNAAHLLNFYGTDTIAGMSTAIDYYNADVNDLAFSVPATEHSVMTSLGKDGESKVVKQLLETYPTGILSVVSDSYDIENFIKNIICKEFKQNILDRDGTFVVRPDSIRNSMDTPEKQMVWIVDKLYDAFGGTINSKGYKVLNPKIKVLWGDGIDTDGITKILELITRCKYSIDCIATFGMGGALLQKSHRDTCRFAFKCSWQQRNGVGYDIYKEPKDASKASKRGRLKLVNNNGVYTTVPESDPRPDILVPVFENGKLLMDYTFSQVRRNANF